ncbi:substrate-binding domain-containing protein [Paenibacillus sp. GCM10027629]|uniref:substrate-binding domain-containing protein n=1 Tax=Paenibacillus sp. GCM10027629 TaxID=3273414 RepID=UPI0036267ECD
MMPRKMLFLLMACCLLLSSCSVDGGLLTDNQERHIDLIVKMDHGDYWSTLRMGAEVAAKEFNVNLRFLAPPNEGDIQGQINLVNDSIQKHPDALLLAASDYMKLAQVTDRAAYNSIPIISIDSEVGSARVKSYIGTNNYEAGQRAAERMIHLLGGSGKIAVMNFVQEARNANQREEGLLDYVARYPNVQIVDIAYCQSSREMASAITREWLHNYPDLDGIITLNAEASIGVGRVVKEAGRGGLLKVIAFDSPQETMEMLQDGTVQALVVQNPFNNGYLAVQYAVELIEGRKIADRIDTGIKVIDLENMLWPENQKLLFPFVR